MQNRLLPIGATINGVTVVNNMNGPPKTAKAVGSVNLPAAWEITKGAQAVVVAIVDTGIVNHPELNNPPANTPLNNYVPGGRFLAGYDFVSVDPLGLGPNVVEGDGNGRDNNPADPGDNVNTAQRTNPLCNDNTPNQNTAPANSTWHGTHSAGIVAATTNNNAGIAGIGWENIRIVPVRALGRCGGSMSDMADAIRWAAGLQVANVLTNNANKAQVILVGAGGKSGVACSQMLQEAITAATNEGAVVVAAAGNEGSLDGMSAPANCSGVISVTAHTIIGDNATYSNIGPPVGGVGPNPSISAPGGGSGSVLGGPSEPTDDPTWDGYRIWSTTPSGNTVPANPPTYSGRIGTSAAAAQVAGVAALVKSRTPSVSPAQIKTAIEASSRPFPEISGCALGRVYNNATTGLNRCGAGMLDATRALQAVSQPQITLQPAAVTVATGATATFSVEAVGAASYQWTRTPGGTIAGATSATYTTPPLAATDNNATFSVVITNAIGQSTTSAPAVVTVSSGSNAPSGGSSSGGGSIPAWQLLFLTTLLFAARVRAGQRNH